MKDEKGMVKECCLIHTCAMEPEELGEWNACRMGGGVLRTAVGV